MKDLQTIEFGDHVHYLGDRSIIQKLREDKVQIKVPHPPEYRQGSRIYHISRWSYSGVRQEMCSKTFIENAQHFKEHGLAKVRTCFGKVTVPHEFIPDTPTLAVRTYCSVETALMNLRYYYKYGYHRFNLGTDTNMDAGVYCYPEISSILFSLDKKENQ